MEFDPEIFYETIINKKDIKFYLYIEDDEAGNNLEKYMPTLTAMLNWEFNSLLDLRKAYKEKLLSGKKMFELINTDDFLEILDFYNIDSNKAILNKITIDDYERGYFFIDSNNILLIASKKSLSEEKDFKNYRKERIKELNIAIYSLFSISIIFSIGFIWFISHLNNISYMIVFILLYLFIAFLSYIKIKEPIELKNKLKV